MKESFAHGLSTSNEPEMTDEQLQESLLGRTVAERFRCDELLGVGGMGRVYKATQLSVNRPVALKVLRAELDGQKEAQDRFMREARTVAGISHPGVVQLVDFGKDPHRDLYFLAMEFVEGVPLSSVMKLGRMRTAVALGIARQIAGALAQAHRAGVVHRDLKPDNVMLVATAEGALQVKVLDFGIALPTSQETRLTKAGAIVGTPHYMSPEQAQDLEITAASDLYSLGIILYEMLAGRLPFVADTPLALLFKHVQTPPPDLSATIEDIPSEVESVVRELLSKVPAERPDTASTLAARLGELEDAVGRQSVTIEVGATDASAFLPLMDVQRATSEATDALGATIDSEPLLGVDSGTLAPKGPTTEPPDGPPETPAPTNAQTPNPDPLDTTAPGQPARSNAPLLALLALVLVGVVGLGWVVSTRLVPPEMPQEAGSSVPEPDEQSELELLEARLEARKSVEFAIHEAARSERETAAIPIDEPPKPKPATKRNADTPKPTTEEHVGADAVTAIGPRHDEVEIPKPGKVAKASNNKPPRIPPPIDEDTLSRRNRALGGICSGDSKCQFDGTHRPGAAVCKDQSTCVARCPIGGCLQFCQDEARCWFSCEGGNCNRMVEPNAKMTEFTD